MQHEHRCSRACGEDVSFRDVKIKIPDRKYNRRMCMTSCTGSVHKGFWGFEKKSVSRVLAPEEDGWLLELAEALWRVQRVLWADGKVSIERLCLSLPYVEKPFNSKVIKSFVPELKSRKCFCVLGFLCYLCALWTLWTFCVLVWKCLFHIFMYGYVTLFYIFILKFNILGTLLLKFI